MRRTLFSIVFYGILSMGLIGCATTPKTVQECETLFPTVAEVQACEVRVVKAEDRRIERAEEEARKDACLFPNFYDSRMGVCRPPHDWSIM